MLHEVLGFISDKPLQIFHLVLLIFLVASSTVVAQSSEFIAEWVVDEHCIEPVSAPDDWTYEGVIVMQDEAGLHGIRADMDTSYFLAFDNDNQFLEMASFSPDGEWLVIPAGYRLPSDYVIPYYTTLEIREFLIFRLTPQRELVRIDGSLFMAYAGADSPMNRIRWVDDQFLFPGLTLAVSPEMSSVYTDYWNALPDDTHRIEVQPTDHTYQLLDYQGQVLFTLDSNRYQFGAFALSPQSDQLAIIRIDHTATPLEATLIIGDIGSNTLWQTCLTTTIETMQDLPALAWSPDGNSLAVNLAGQILVVESSSRQAYRVLSSIGRVREWLPN